MAISTSQKDCNQAKNGKYLLCKITWFPHQISFRDLPKNAEENSFGKASQLRISSVKISTNMSGNLFLLAVVFIMCYFINKGENYAVTKITRAQRDYFTDVCQNCHEYGAEPGQGICKCEPKSISAGSNSLFLRNQGHCVDEDVIMSKCMFLCYNM